MKDYASPEVTKLLTFGNRIWTSKANYGRISGKFLESTSANYNAEVETLHTIKPERAVNDWVKQVTKGKIEKIVGKLKLLCTVEEIANCADIQI